MTASVKSDRAAASAKPRRSRHGRRRPIQHAFEYAVFRALLATLTLLPHRVLSGCLACLLQFYGFVLALIGGQGHRAGLINLEIAFPEKSSAERRRMLRDMWRSWGRYIADSAYLSKLTREQVSGLVDNDTQAHYDEINETAKHRGVLILTGHYGSFELFHSSMAVKGTPISLVQRAMNNPHFETYLRNLRQRFGTKTLIRGDAAREIFRELKSGGVVAIPFDQSPHRELRIFTPFFGIDAATNSGLARLALRSGAAVHPAFLIRIGSTLRHKAYLGPPLDIVRTGDMERDILENSRLFNRVLEDMVRQHPDHWIWMYRRWRQRPDGMCSPYLKEAPPLDVYRRATAEADSPKGT